MSIAEFLDGGRAMAEARMTATCRITRKTGQELDEETGQYVATTVTVYEGRCRVKVAGSLPQQELAGERAYTLSRYELHVPVSTLGVAVDDTAVVLTSDTDPELVGRSFRIVAPFHGSQTTARRYPVEEVQG